MSIDAAATSLGAPVDASDAWSVPTSPRSEARGENRLSETGPRELLALLSLARRAGAASGRDALVDDAGNALAEVLDADAYGFGEVVDGTGEMEFILAGAYPDEDGAKRISRRGSLDPNASILACAIQAGTPIVASNVASDPRFTDLLVRQFEVASALAMPLRLGGKTVGALAAFRKEARNFTREDARFVEAVGHMLIASVARITLEEETFRFRLFADGVLENTDALVLKLDPQGNLLDMNQACRRATGFEPADVRGQPLVNVLAVAEEAETIHEHLRRAKRAKADDPDGEIRFESQLLTKLGKLRRVAWSLRPLRDYDGTVVYLLLIGSDLAELAAAASQSSQSRRRATDVPTPAEEYAGIFDVQNREDVAAQRRSPDSESPPAAADEPGPSPTPSRRASKRSATDSRSSSRRAFPCRQRIAPILGDELPGPDDFFNVECENISASGIAFHLKRPPDFETLVVALGKGPRQSYVSARVVRCTFAERDGERGCLVGCCFTGKVVLP
jgi:PAS domain S-box-containing protein